MIKTSHTLLFATIYLTAFFTITTSVSEAQELYLNEILASNATGLEDEDGDTEDWIEIYYTGSEPLSLEGFGLSDDYDRPFRWEFPDITIGPGEFLLIWASGKDRTDTDNPLHTNFSIAATGEEVLITAPDGTRIDELAPTPIPTDISLGRKPDGTGDWYFFNEPTPGAPNITSGYQELLEPVEFSHSGGFYTGSFDLTLNHPDPDVTIVYTLDGSEPDPENLDGQTYQYKNRYRYNSWDSDGSLVNATFQSFEYSNPIGITNRTNDENRISRIHSTYDNAHSPNYFPSQSIFKGTVIRAKAVKTGALSSTETTHTYFVTPEGRSRYSLPVVSFAIQEDYLFDYESGIYVPGTIYDNWRSDEGGTPDGGTPANYHQRGIKWEFPAYMELYEENDIEASLKQLMGVRIHGGWSRSFPMKSLRLYARNMYSDNRFYHRIFPDLPYTAYNRLMLRNSGNDFEFTLFRDAAMQEVVGHMNFDVQAYRPAIVFINGEYWGIHNFRERYDRHYLSRVYNLEDDRVDLLEGNAWVKEGSNTHYNETIDYIETYGLSGDDHYEYIQTRIDVENFVDYQIAQIYLGNEDWPGNNMDYWRYQTNQYEPDAPYGKDGRWRWLMYDTDFGFGLYGRQPSINSIRFATEPNGPSWPNPPWSTFLLRSFLENETFRHTFINRFADQLNTAFRPERVHSIIDEMADVLVPEIAEQLERWNRPAWGSLSGWNDQINVMQNFVSSRPSHVRNHIAEFFNIQEQVEITVNVNESSAGYVRMNTVDIKGTTPGVDPAPYPWTGTYFHNIPITLKAETYPGYVFSHWEGYNGDESDPEIVLPMVTDKSITAVFEIDHDADFFPEPFKLSEGVYTFDEWSADLPAGVYPDNMAFVYMDELEPGLDAHVDDFTYGVYDLDSRTRINGLGNDGFAFINTSNEEGNPGYPGRRLGGAILALNTQGKKDIDVTWEGLTVLPNSRVYNLRLQYRLGDEGQFIDVTDNSGNPVEYERNENESHREQIGPIRLPAEVDNKAYVQLFWRYYYTGKRVDEESGQRSKMAVSNIEVKATDDFVTEVQSKDELPEMFELYQNYPNPFNSSTQIMFALTEANNVKLNVYDVLGREVVQLVDGFMDPGLHTVTFDASELSTGLYIFRIQTGEYVESKRMLYLK